MAESPSLPERIDLTQADDPRDVVHRAVASLAHGEIIGLATETVYGLVASALRPAAVSRLRQIQGLDTSSPLTLLLREPGELPDWVPHLSAMGRRLSRRAWPGPVTLVFPDNSTSGLTRRLPAEVQPLIFPEASVSFRVPAHPFVREVLKLSHGPLVLSKALNPENLAAITSESLTGRSELGMIVDDGPTHHGEVATVVRVEGDTWQVLRPGVIDERTLTQMAGTILLFVCTGNTCRSPMAEALCKVALARRLDCRLEELEERGFVVLSAGMSATSGMPAAAHAIDVVQARGGSLRDHMSRQIDATLVRQVDHIIAMTGDHLESLVDHLPDAAPRTRLLHPEGEDVADPVGADHATYLHTAQAIESYLEALLDDLGIGTQVS